MYTGRAETRLCIPQVCSTSPLCVHVDLCAPLCVCVYVYTHTHGRAHIYRYFAHACVPPHRDVSVGATLRTDGREERTCTMHECAHIHRARARFIPGGTLRRAEMREREKTQKCCAMQESMDASCKLTKRDFFIRYERQILSQRDVNAECAR